MNGRRRAIKGGERVQPRRAAEPGPHGPSGAQAAAEVVTIDLREATPRLDLALANLALVAPRYVVAGRWARSLKRMIDIVGSLMILVLAAIPMVIIAVAVKAGSWGSVFFVQDRVGQGGKTIRVAKFRSMHRDAEERRRALDSLNEADGPIFKMRNDPRVTRVGRFLRKSSLDELPQLLLVLQGDMSLVGPRPALPGEVSQYKDRERIRLAAKPGMTCLPQVRGRSNLTFESAVDLEVEYLYRWSIGLDLKILLLTVPAVVTGRGAY